MATSSVCDKLPNEKQVTHFHKLINLADSETNYYIYVILFHICRRTAKIFIPRGSQMKAKVYDMELHQNEKIHNNL